MKKLCLIDLSGLFWANWHATEAHPVGEAFSRTVEQVRRYADGFDLVAVCCDAPPYKRREIFPDYKATRDAHPPQALQQLDDVKQRIADDGTLLWSVRGFEADDVIATATRLALAEEYPLEVTVFSGDKDLLQLVGELVTVISPRSGPYNDAKVREKFGVPAHLMGDLLALMGDDSDNIPGIAGVGVKTAAKLLADFGSLEGVLGGALAIKGDALREKVIAGADVARLARRCVELETGVPIDWDALFVKREPKPVEKREDFSNMDDEDIGQNDAAWSPAEADTEPPSGAIGLAEDSRIEDVPPQGGLNLKGEPTPLRVRSPSTELALAKAQTALARPVSFELGLEPQSIGGAYKLAVGMFESGLYSKFRKPEAIWAVMIRGREMGLGALTALDCFHVIEGKPAPHAHLIISRAKAHPDCEYFTFLDKESGPTKAVWETKNRRTGAVIKHEYTLAEAQRSGVCPMNMRPEPVWKPKAGGDGMKDIRGNWEKRTAEMLRKTCGVQLVRIEYPDAALGLYAVEELTDDD